MRIVRITAMWCMSCLAMKKTWKKVFKHFDDVQIIDLDFDFDAEAMKHYDVGKTLPILIVFDKDKEIGRIIGEKSVSEMMTLIQEFHEKIA